jgi:hypothetical protein
LYKLLLFQISSKTGQCSKAIFTCGTSRQNANESGHIKEREINNNFKVLNGSNIKMR